MSLNICALTGRLGKNPDIRNTNDGGNVVRFSLAVERDRKDKDGNKVVDWFNVVFWNGRAFAEKTNLGKGDTVTVSGRLQNNNWTDKDGNSHSETEVKCEHIDFIRHRRDSEKSAKDQATDDAAQRYDESEADDLPF